MSKVGKKPILIPEKTSVTFTDGVFTVTGPKGALSKEFRPDVAVAIDGNTITLTPARPTKFARSLWGTYASHIRNMIEGVTNPYVKKLVIEGIGYRAEVSGTSLNMNLGFSHPVKMPIPQGVTAAVEKNVITLTGIDKEVVGQFASNIRLKKKPEPYKGKGIRYENEVVRRKQGKKATA